MQPGQTLVNKKFNTRMKILGRAHEIIFTSSTQDFTEPASCFWTEQELEKEGWSLLEEPWVPDYNEDYWYVSSDGNILFQRRAIEDGSATEFRISAGNAHKTSKAAELYKQKLVERMGRKEA